MSRTGTPQSPPRRRLRPRWRYAGLLVGVLLVAGVLVFAVSRLNLHRIGHALVNASPGWIALALLAAVTFSSVSLFHGREAGLAGALAVPVLIGVLVFAGPGLLRLGQRSRFDRVRNAASLLTRLLQLARSGLAMFTRPSHGVPAVAAQLGAWALQWGS